MLNLRRRPTPFKFLLILSLMQLLNDSFSSRVSPRCFRATDLSIGWSLKKRLGWKHYLSFLENMTSWVCLFLSGLNDISNSWILTRSLFSVADEASTSCITENNEVSPATNLISECRPLRKVTNINEEKKWP